MGETAAGRYSASADHADPARPGALTLANSSRSCRRRDQARKPGKRGDHRTHQCATSWTGSACSASDAVAAIKTMLGTVLASPVVIWSGKTDLELADRSSTASSTRRATGRSGQGRTGRQHPNGCCARPSITATSRHTRLGRTKIRRRSPRSPARSAPARIEAVISSRECDSLATDVRPARCASHRAIGNPPSNSAGLGNYHGLLMRNARRRPTGRVDETAEHLHAGPAQPPGSTAWPQSGPIGSRPDRGSRHRHRTALPTARASGLLDRVGSVFVAAPSPSFSR